MWGVKIWLLDCITLANVYSPIQAWFILISLLSTLFHWRSLLIRWSSVSAITTRSSAYNSSRYHVDTTMFTNHDQMWHTKLDPWLCHSSMTITNNNELLVHSIYCYHTLFWQLFFAPVYIDMSADTSYSSTPCLCIANLITSVWTLTSLFQIHKAKRKLLSFNSKILVPFINQTTYHLSESAAKFCFQRSFPQLS